MLPYKKIRQSRKKRKMRKARKTRKIQLGGNIINVTYRSFGRVVEPVDTSIIQTWGQLKEYNKQKNPPKSIVSMNAGIEHDDDPLQDGMDVRISDYFEPEALVLKLLTDDQQDYDKISRDRKKFAVSTNGGGYYPDYNTLKSYNEREIAEFLQVLSQNYGFPIGFMDNGDITLCDIESANRLLGIFKEEGIYNEIEDIFHFYREIAHEDDNKMYFIHILFGEIRGYGGIEPASNDTAYQREIEVSVAVNFGELPPTIQMIIVKFYSMFS